MIAELRRVFELFEQETGKRLEAIVVPRVVREAVSVEAFDGASVIAGVQSDFRGLYIDGVRIDGGFR